jgi:hypothetical protein
MPLGREGMFCPGPKADRISIWPMDDGSYGLDATFQGASGYEYACIHEAALTDSGIRYSLRQELDGGWTLRFGPIAAVQAAAAVQAFVV